MEQFFSITKDLISSPRSSTPTLLISATSTPRFFKLNPTFMGAPPGILPVGSMSQRISPKQQTYSFLLFISQQIHLQMNFRYLFDQFLFKVLERNAFRFGHHQGYV